MKIDEDLKIQLDEAFERGTTKAELDLIREEYEKKKDSPLDSGESDSRSKDTPLPVGSQPQTEEVEIESETVVEPESTPEIRPALRQDFFSPTAPIQMDQSAIDAQKDLDLEMRYFVNKSLKPAENPVQKRINQEAVDFFTNDAIENVRSNDDPEFDFSELDAAIRSSTNRSAGGAPIGNQAFKDFFSAPAARGLNTLLGVGLKTLAAIEGQALSFTPGMRESAFESEAKAMEKISKESNARAEEIRKYYNAYQPKGDALDALGFGDAEFKPYDAFVLTGQAIFETGPLIAASALSGVASYPLLFAYGVSAAQDEAVGQDWYESMNPAEKMGYLSLFGSLEAIPEAVGGYTVKRALKKYLSGQLAEKTFRRTTREFAKGAVRASGLDVLSNSGTEAVTGFGQELLQQAAKGEDINIGKALREAVNGALLGFAAGTAYASPGIVTDVTAISNGLGQDFSMYRAKKNVEKYTELLKDPSLTDNQKRLYRTELKNAIDKRMQVSIENRDFYQRVGQESPKALNRMAELDQRMQSVMIKAANNRDANNRVIDKALEARYSAELKDLYAQYNEAVAPFKIAEIDSDRLSEERVATEQEQVDKAREGQVKEFRTGVPGLTGFTVTEWMDQETNQTKDPDGSNAELGRAVQRGESVLGGKIPFVIHRNGTLYADNMNRLDPGTKANKSEAGRLIRNPETNRNEIHINASRADAVDVAHEVFHGVFLEQFGQNKAIANRMAQSLRKAMQKSSAADRQLVALAEQAIMSYDESVSAEEFLAEIGGELTSVYRELSTGGKRSFTRGLVSFIDNILKRVGITNLSNLREQLDSEQEVINFLNKFNRAFNQGIRGEEFEIVDAVEQESPTETRQKESLPPDATPDELARFEKEAPARKAKAKKKAAEKKKKEAEVKERFKAEDELQKERDKKDAEKLQREDDIRSGKIEDFVEREIELMNELDGATGTIAETRQKVEGALPRRKINMQAESDVVKRSESWKKLISKNPSEFAGEVIITTPSDRMAVAQFVFSDGTTLDLKGGFGYAQEVGLPWASATETALNKWMKKVNAQIKEKGYAYLAPTIMGDDSHSSNFQFLLAGIGEVRSAIKEGKATEADVRAKLEKISEMYVGKAPDKFKEDADGNRIKDKDGNDILVKKGESFYLPDFTGLLKEKNINKVLDKLPKIFAVGKASFVARKNFISRLLGPTGSKAKNPKQGIKGVLAGSELVKKTMDPTLVDVPRGYIPGLIKITEPLTAVETTSKDGFEFHESYPWTAKTPSGKGVEFIPFTEGISMTELEEGSVNFDDLLEEFNGNEEKALTSFFSKMGMASAAGSQEVRIVDQAIVEEEKLNKEKNRIAETRQRKKQDDYKKVVGDIRAESSIQKTFTQYKDSFMTEFTRRSENLSTKFVDKYYPVVKFQREFQKRTGRKLDISQDVINALTLADSKTAAQLAEFEEQRKELADAIRESGATLEDLGNLIYAIHAPEANAVGLAANKKNGEASSGMSNEEALGYLEQFNLTLDDLQSMETLEDALVSRGQEKIWDVLSKVYQITEDNRQTLMSSGLATGLAQAKTITRDGKKIYQILDGQDPNIVLKEFKSLGPRNKALNKLNAWNRNYKFYVPLQGFAIEEVELGVDQDHFTEYLSRKEKKEKEAKEIDDAAAGRGKSQEIKAPLVRERKGRITKAENPLVQVLSNRAHTIVKAEKNQTMRRLYDLVSDPDNAKAMEGYVKNVYKFNPNKNSLKEIFENPNAITVWRNGERYVMELEDARMVAALDGSNVTSLNAFVKGMGVLNRLMSSTITMMDPEFVLRNFTRDIQAALVNLTGKDAQAIMDEGNKEAGVKGVMANLMPAFRAIRTQEVSKKGAANIFKGYGKRKARMDARQEVVSKYYDEFKKMGAKTAWFMPPSVKEIVADIEKAFPDNNKPSKVQKGANSVNQAQKAMFKVIEGYNSSVENAVRLAAYVTARERGVSSDKAAELAKNLTVNFNRSGSAGSFYNSLYLFMNASVQGSATILRVIDPRSVGILKKDKFGLLNPIGLKLNRPQQIAGSMAVFGAITTLLNQMLWSDEEEDGRTVYEKLPSWEKQTNYVIVAGDKVFKIPLPYGYNAFYYAGVAAAEAALGIQRPGEALSSTVGATIGAFSPVNFPQSESQLTFMAKTLIPSGMRWFTDLLFNEDYFGSKIYNEPSEYDKSPLPLSSDSRKETTGLSKILARGINKFGGGGYDRKGTFDIPAEAFDYIATYFLGGVGKFIKRSNITGKAIADAVSKTEASDPLNYVQNLSKNLEVQAKQVPFLRVFVSSPNQYADFEKFTEFEKIMDTMKDRKGLSTPMFKDYLALNKALKFTQKRMRVVNNDIKKVKSAIDKGVTTYRGRNAEDVLNDLYDLRSSFQVNFNKEMMKDQYKDFLKEYRKDVVTVDRDAADQKERLKRLRK